MNLSNCKPVPPSERERHNPQRHFWRHVEDKTLDLWHAKAVDRPEGHMFTHQALVSLSTVQKLFLDDVHSVNHVMFREDHNTHHKFEVAKEEDNSSVVVWSLYQALKLLHTQDVLTCVCPTTPQPGLCSGAPPWWRWRRSFPSPTPSGGGSPHTVEPACREKEPQTMLTGGNHSYRVVWWERFPLPGLMGDTIALRFVFFPPQLWRALH